MTKHALDGIRILDLSRVLAGPLCTMMLGDHGADVIKVEPPGGDETRRYGPPFVEEESVYYLGINRNKRGISLDLSVTEGQAIIRRLVQSSDVLVENFKAGTMERWGLGYEQLRQLNPRLIYCSISGFGRTGPYANVAGYDGAVQALGGMMSINGEMGREPQKAGLALCDLTTGMFAMQGVILALLSRAATGLGQQVEVSLLASIVAMLHPHNAAYLNAGVVAKPQGNTHPMVSPYDLIQTADRPIYIPVGNEGQMKRLSQVVGRPELSEDPRFRTNLDRVTNRPALLAILHDALSTRTAAEWCHLLWNAGVPAGPVNNMAEVFADPQVVFQEIVQEIPHPTLGSIRLPGLPITLTETPGAIMRPPPMLGQHTTEVLREAGISDAELADLVTKGIALQWSGHAASQT